MWMIWLSLVITFAFMFEIITQLGNRFSLKDMRQLFFFLGIKVISIKSRIFFLSRHKYIQDVLLKTNMISAKNVSIPLPTSTSLKLVDGSSPTNSTNFISFIGAPQYMSLTHPDIFFLVYKLSQFIHKHTVTHWTTAKRLLCYLKQTIFSGIHIKKKSRFELITYSNADWVSNYDDRTST